MQKKMIKTLLASSLFLGFVACSDMAVESNEAIAMPSDFTVEEYSKINKDVKYQQIHKELLDNVYFNKARQDTIKNSVYVYNKAEDGTVLDSTLVVNYVDRPEGAKNAWDARKIAQQHWDDDIEDFLTDTALVHEIFVDYLMFPEESWEGVDKLDADQVSFISAYNIQQSGKPDVKADRKYLKEFKFDDELISKHYLMLGMYEGRAYRYCTSKDNVADASKAVPDSLGVSSPKMPDYSAYRFCYDSKKDQKFLIK